MQWTFKKKKKGNENLSTYLSYIIVVYVKRRVSSCEKVKVAHGIRVGKAFWGVFTS